MATEPQLLVPEHVAREREVERFFGRSVAWVEDYNRRLAEIDPCLELVKARPTAKEPGLVPGYWHVKRQNKDGTVAFIPITGLNGEFVEPTEQHLEELRSRDLWNSRVLRDRRSRAERRAADRQHRKELEREQRRYELARNIYNLENPGVLFSDSPWVNKAGARRG